MLKKITNLSIVLFNLVVNGFFGFPNPIDNDFQKPVCIGKKTEPIVSQLPTNVAIRKTIDCKNVGYMFGAHGTAVAVDLFSDQHDYKELYYEKIIVGAPMRNLNPGQKNKRTEESRRFS